jgi:hypothetical protein
MAKPVMTTMIATGVLALLISAPSMAVAGEFYGGIGVPGLMAGYAQAVSDLVVLRADVATLGTRRKDGVQEGIDYRGTLKANRLGAFADYFPWGTPFRLTAGLTLNQMRVDLRSDFATGQLVTVGNNTVVVPPGQSYYFNVRVKVPEFTPYLGVGWGHRDAAPGWGVVADLGASLGKAKVSVDTNVASAGISQADIDRETQQIKDGVGQIRVIPQLSLGVSYRY